MWPRLFPKLVADDSCVWLDCVKERVAVSRLVKYNLKIMSKKWCLTKGSYLSHYAFDSFVAYIKEDERLEMFIIDELRFMLNDKNANRNLTFKFYANQAVKYLMQRQLNVLWHRWLNADVVALETGAHLFAQWFQPDVYVELDAITKFLDEVAENVKIVLSETHPAVVQLINQTGYLDHNNLTESLWDAAVCKQILLALNTVFCNRYNFVGDEDTYYNLENSLLNNVIERRKGIPITLCILYHAIARRLGVYCFPVNFPSHFVLKFDENPKLNDSVRFTFIDVFNRCRMMSQFELWSKLMAHSGVPESPGHFAVPSHLAVLKRMVTNVSRMDESPEVLCQAFELRIILEPTDEIRNALARCYLKIGINYDLVIQLLSNTQDANDPNFEFRRQYYTQMAVMRLQQDEITNSEPVKPKLRSDLSDKPVQFAVGMIMRHKLYGYSCVISGWDPYCCASPSWQQEMGVQRLDRKHKQPFYNVLVNDSSIRYAAEENLYFDPSPAPVTHPEIGKFFDAYFGPFYKMNEAYTLSYPEDEDIVLNVYKNSSAENL